MQGGRARLPAPPDPLGRFGQSEEIAGTVAFLASDDGGFFIGETLSPNGGIVTT